VADAFACTGCGRDGRPCHHDVLPAHRCINRVRDTTLDTFTTGQWFSSPGKYSDLPDTPPF
jgi:hypothetical protein